MATDIATAAGSQVTGGITAASAFTVPTPDLGSLFGGPSYDVGSFAERMLGTSTADVLGGAAAGLGQMVAEPILGGMISGVPAEDEQAAIDAFNAQYNYTPSSSELYTFYTNEFVPSQQVNVAQTIGGIPGYGNILAAGGGYIDGVGGPKSDSNLARLSDGEFVMTEAAVRGAGYGDRIAGARRMYDLMNGLEKRAA